MVRNTAIFSLRYFLPIVVTKDRTMKDFLFALLLVSISSTAVDADIFIDNYDAGTTLTQTFAGNNTKTTVDGGILGGSRDESITVRDLGGSEFFGALGFNGDFTISQGDDDQSFGSLTYNDFAAFDITDGGSNDRFNIGFVNNEVDSVLTDVFSITAVSGANSFTETFSVPASSSLPSTVAIDFSSFTGVDFTQLDSVQLAFDFATVPGSGVSLSSFSASSAVPEPTSILVLGVMSTGLMLRRRRRPIKS
jgi:hypothetical protein